MTREKTIQGLQFTIEMCLFDPMTGAKRPKESLNDLDKTTVDACEGAIKLLEQEPTTKNDLAQERYQDLMEYFGDKETAKTILEDKKEFKAWLERVKWHVKRADELARELEALEQEPNTKNDLVVDCISKEAVVDAFGKWCSDDKNLEHPVWFARDIISMPSITPLEPKIGHWIDDKCSVCGKGIEDLIDSREWYRNEEPKFCPFCGIKLIDSQVGDEK